MHLKALLLTSKRSQAARTIVLLMFASLLIVQGVFIVPNLWSFEHNLISVLSSAEKDKLSLFMAQLEERGQISELESSGRLLGATVLNSNTDKRYEFGTVPSIQALPSLVGNVKLLAGAQADVVWGVNNPLGDYIVAARLDVAGVSEQLKSYALKLLGIALLVSCLTAFLGFWICVKYFYQPLERVISLLRDSRLEGRDGIEEFKQLANFEEFSGLVEEYNCMISDQREATRQVKVKQQFLEYAAHHDPLTHLPNRLMFDDKLKTLVTESLDQGQPFAVYLLDIDNFKFFNDQYGHDVGDKMVKEIGNRLISMMRDVDTVARLDGDEFVVLQTDISDRKSTEEVAKRMLKLLSGSFEYRGFTLKTTASIGVSFFPDDVHLAHDNSLLSEEIVNNASVALQEAKILGRGGYQVFNEIMRKRITERMTLEEDLKTGLMEEQFEVFYQPKVNMQTGEVLGSEALVRWHHPTMGNVRPDIFIPVAEESGIIIPLGEWILRTACKDTLALQEMGLGDLQVAVNISAVQFTGGDLLPMVRKALEESQFSADLLELEITESAVMHDPEEVIRSLHELSRFGIKLAIDDFGTGYSSLAYLKRFPVDTLKIDRAFIKDISRDSDDVVIVEAILGLGKHFGLKVVAEGVEDNEQLEFLRQQGCDIAQGYHLSPPLAFDQYVAWLEDWNKEREEITQKSNIIDDTVVKLHN